VGLSKASRARRADVLAGIGTTTEFVLLDLEDAARDNPALQVELVRCTTDEEREELAFEHFENHPQPTERRNWPGYEDGSPLVHINPWDESSPTFRTPDWPDRRLPRLDGFEADDEDEPPHAEPAGGQSQAKVGRPPGSYIEPDTFWAVWEMALDGMSARTIAMKTDHRSDLKLANTAKAGVKFVNRAKASVIVKAVNKNKAAARRDLAGQKIPQGFSATDFGIRLPMPKPA
jgi:hypothetical protein